MGCKVAVRCTAALIVFPLRGLPGLPVEIAHNMLFSAHACIEEYQLSHKRMSGCGCAAKELADVLQLLSC